jgi:large subunit ribosomal protein L28
MVSFSHRRNKKLQHVNVQETRLCWEKENRWVRVNVAAKTLRTISKLGLDEVAKRYNVDLYSLPYSDIGSNRSEWLAANNKPPTKKNKRAMKHEAPKAEA